MNQELTDVFQALTIIKDGKVNKPTYDLVCTLLTEREVMFLDYVLEEIPLRSDSDIAKHFDITEERVQVFENRIVRKIVAFVEQSKGGDENVS